MSISHPRRVDFERHVKRLAWYALLASLVLLVPIGVSSVAVNLQLAGALAVAVLVVAVWALIRDVSGYLRGEQARRREAADVSRQAGAILTADAIQDRVANLLSLTVGYVEFLAEDEDLPPPTRAHAQRALDGAVAAARVVSLFKQALGNDQLPKAWRQSEADGRCTHVAWSYDVETRTVSAGDGAIMAMISPGLDPTTATAVGNLIAAAPALLDTLADAQQVGVSLLAGPRTRNLEADMRSSLERINSLTTRLQD